MAIATEVQSLNDIQYKSKIKILILVMIICCLFVFSFINFYPVGEKLKTIVKASFVGKACQPDFDEIRLEWFLPKIIVSNLVIPANCLERTGEPLNFAHLTLNYTIINFAPFGLPFRIDTAFAGQPISLYYVLGFNSQMIRLKDQNFDLKKLQPLLGDRVKLIGKVTVDLNMKMTKTRINSLNLKAQSKNLQLPPQNIMGLTTPFLKLNEFFLEAISEAHPRIQIEKLILGDMDAPIRANFKGQIDLQNGNVGMSPLDLKGEVAFSEALKTALPLEGIFNEFPQKDGLYQIRLGGTLESLTPIKP